MMKKIIGILMIATAFLVLFAGHVAQHGLVGALIGWGIALSVMVFLVVGVLLITSD